jgi:predicted DNA binding protein
MIEPVLPGNTIAFRWTCDLCGYHRADSGVEQTNLIHARHVCPEDPMANGKTVILLCWEELDKVIDKIKDTSAPEQFREVAKYQAQGMAAIMVKWTAPHFRTTADISAEALARWQARQAGEERHTRGTVIATAGPDLRATFALEGRSSSGARPVRTTTPRPAPSKQFTPDEVAAIRAAFGAGADMKMLTTAFKCSEDNIKTVLEAAS